MAKVRVYDPKGVAHDVDGCDAKEYVESGHYSYDAPDLRTADQKKADAAADEANAAAAAEAEKKAAEERKAKEEADEKARKAAKDAVNAGNDPNKTRNFVAGDKK